MREKKRERNNATDGQTDRRQCVIKCEQLAASRQQQSTASRNKVGTISYCKSQLRFKRQPPSLLFYRTSPFIFIPPGSPFFPTCACASPYSSRGSRPYGNALSSQAGPHRARLLNTQFTVMCMVTIRTIIQIIDQ